MLPSSIAPGATPEEARNTIGLGREVTVGVVRALSEVPLILGTTLISSTAESTVGDQPVSVGAVDDETSAGTRLISVVVNTLATSRYKTSTAPAIRQTVLDPPA